VGGNWGIDKIKFGLRFSHFLLWREEGSGRANIGPLHVNLTRPDATRPDPSSSSSSSRRPLAFYSLSLSLRGFLFFFVSPARAS